MMKKFAQPFLKHKMNTALVLSATLVLSSLFTQETSALFTAQTNLTSNTVSTATLNITTNPATALFQVSNVVPGDSITRTLSVINSGTADFTYNIKNSGMNTLLFTDAAKGLQLDIKKGAATYYSGPISGLNANSASALTIAHGASDTLTFVISLPIAADNLFQSLSETIEFSFNATQIPGTAR
ncbi:Camelysin metallo-endopeptidase [Paenibacillus sp. 1_12]|uniref:TasA family protein n=1 Tax=Paenibacillus sp. 1_12 TaxID=1566278 RepID=UPI0008DF2A54|nr:TasA family protein [Paenibacillus sp. 1_12]SFL74467.1 Camelysin metallo-endopeptidase [Paenibacillus sp. 1_12]